MLSGIDVSDYQGEIDWTRVPAQWVDFAFCKATQGTGFTCWGLHHNWAGIKAAGLVRGAYHYAYADSVDHSANDEANHFIAELTNAGGVEPGDLLALDIETGNGDLREWVTTWMQTVQTLTGVKPMLYSRVNFMDEHNLKDLDVPLWIAAYGTDEPPSGTTIWQYTDKGTVEGIQAWVDKDVYTGTREELQALGKPPATPLVGALNRLWDFREALLNMSGAIRPFSAELSLPLDKWQQLVFDCIVDLKKATGLQ